MARHLRQVADTLESCVRELRDASVVLVSTDETQAEFRSVLANDVKAAIVGTAQAEAHAGPAELLAAVEPLLAERRSAKEQALLARWRELAAREERASAGWADTLTAASDGRVEQLLVHAGVDRPAYRCSQCGRVEADSGACVIDGTELEEEQHGLDLAVHQTLAHGGTVHVVRDERDLDPVGGIGALLRY